MLTIQVIGMYARSQARYKGIGEALLRAAIRHAEERQGTKVITLTFTEGNATAIPHPCPDPLIPFATNGV